VDRIDYTFLPQALVGIKPLGSCRRLPHPAVGGKVKGDSCASSLASPCLGSSRGKAPFPRSHGICSARPAQGRREQAPTPRQAGESNSEGRPTRDRCEAREQSAPPRCAHVPARWEAMRSPPPWHDRRLHDAHRCWPGWPSWGRCSTGCCLRRS